MVLAVLYKVYIVRQVISLVDTVSSESKKETKGSHGSLREEAAINKAEDDLEQLISEGAKIV